MIQQEKRMLTNIEFESSRWRFSMFLHKNAIFLKIKPSRLFEESGLLELKTEISSVIYLCSITYPSQIVLKKKATKVDVRKGI